MGSLLLLAAVLTYVGTAAVVTEGFRTVETEDARQNVDRARRALQGEIDNLSLRANDWSAWDDAWAFVRDGNQGFVDSNMQDQTYQEQKLNGMVFLRPNGSVTWSKFWDFDANGPMEAPEGLMASLAPGNPLNSHHETTDWAAGILLLPGGPVIVASRPIITSDRTGPIAGTLVWIKLLRPERVQEIRERTSLKIDVRTWGEPGPAPVWSEARAALQAGGSAFPVFVTGSDRIESFAFLPDVAGRPALLLNVTLPRNIFAQARRSLVTSLATFAVLGLAFAVILGLAVDRLVVRRMLAMSAGVQGVTDSADRTRRIAVEGADEIARLSQNINSLLESVQKAESELVRAREDALNAAGAKARFLANMSHEIRTPLNGVIGLGRLVLETPLSPVQREYMISLRSAGLTLLGIVNGILDLSKIEAGRMTLEQIPFALSRLVDDTLATLLPKAEEKGLVLEAEIHSGTPSALRGDPLRLRQVLTNLVGNALKFTDRGSVRVLVDCLGLAGDSARLRVSVIDTGIGIPEDVRSRLFENFSQGDDSTSRKYGGSGLGLAISRQLVLLMGGSLNVDSAPGRGSTFWFELSLPVHVGALPDSDAADAFPPPASRSLHVLLADDNAVNRLVGERTLQRLGHSVTVVADGPAAVRAAAEEPFDAVLMDVQMPGMDGYEAAKRIHALPKCAALPILALTANSFPGATEESLKSGMQGHLTKPLDPSLLGAELDRVTLQPSDRASSGVGPIDMGRLLEHVGGDTALLREIVTVFLRSADEQISDLRSAVESGLAQRIEETAHRSNGSLKTVGAFRAALHAGSMEAAARRGDVASARSEWEKLGPCWVEALVALRAVLEESASGREGR